MRQIVGHRSLCLRQESRRLVPEVTRCDAHVPKQARQGLDLGGRERVESEISLVEGGGHRLHRGHPRRGDSREGPPTVGGVRQSLDKAVSPGKPMDWREATRAVRDAAAGLRLAVLTGSDKTKARRDAEAAVAAGDIDIVVGTHALFQASVAFRNLTLAEDTGTEGDLVSRMAAE